MQVMLGSLLVILLVQSVFLPCLCYKGQVKMTLATTLDLLILLRVVAARLRKERNNNWIIYLILAGSSLFWIPLMVGE